MIKNKSSLQIMVIFITAVAVIAILPNVSKAAISSTGYDFEKVEVGTSKTTFVSITNFGETDTLISGVVFANTTCSDFSVVYIPDLPIDLADPSFLTLTRLWLQCLLKHKQTISDEILPFPKTSD